MAIVEGNIAIAEQGDAEDTLWAKKNSDFLHALAKFMQGKKDCDEFGTTQFKFMKQDSSGKFGLFEKIGANWVAVNVFGSMITDEFVSTVPMGGLQIAGGDGHNYSIARTSPTGNGTEAVFGNYASKTYVVSNIDGVFVTYETQVKHVDTINDSAVGFTASKISNVVVAPLSPRMQYGGADWAGGKLYLESSPSTEDILVRSWAMSSTGKLLHETISEDRWNSTGDTLWLTQHGAEAVSFVAGQNWVSLPTSIPLPISDTTGNITFHWEFKKAINGVGTATTPKMDWATEELAVERVATREWVAKNSSGGGGVITEGTNTGVGETALSSITTGQHNSAFGEGALKTNAEGNYNSATGYYALPKNTAGNNNTANGNEALFKNETGSYNVAVGNEALYSNETGNSNIALGNRALHSNKAGNSNIANGHYALYMNTADYNIANGDQALYYNTTGSNNIANGYFSLYYNKTGNNNSASGNYCMYRNDSGSNNIANGFNALYKNLSGNHNVALGYQAMYKNTGGSDNIANGYMALFSNTTGHKNIAFGHQALTESTTGYYNIAHGYRALWQNKSGIHNIASGYQSLLNNTTGGRNIGIGKSAGSDLYTGDNNVFIGSMSAPASSNQSHSITLGDTYIASLRCAVNTISSLSDERDKTNIVDSTLGLDYINQLRPVEFEWDYRQEHYVDGEAPSKNGTKEVGFIAQELKAVQDEANAEHLKTYQHYPAEVGEDGKPLEGAMGIDVMEADYGKLLPVAIQAIKELSAKVAELEARL